MSEPANEAPSREEQLRAARVRALAAFVGMIVFAAGGFYWLRIQDSPPGTCSSSKECPGLGYECLHAPTGAYCTHTCNRDADCDPGMHCDIPPWEKATTRTLCIHDTANIGKN